MKRLGVLAISLILVITGYLLPNKAFAAITTTDLNNLQSFTSTFSSIDSSFGSRFSSMVTSVYNRFSNDPDIDANSFRRYVLEGIPGTTIPDQQGFIPYLNGIISTSPNTDLVSKAKIALSQAQYLLNNAQVREQLAGGSITQDQANAATLQNAQANSAGTSAVLQDRTQTTEKCTSLMNASIKDCIDAGFTWLIKNTLLQIAGFLVWLTGNMMNYAIQTGILNFSKWAPTSLYPLWIVVRQIISLAIVFAGLYLGFMYIIGREDTFGRYIGWVVLFALFVNFSYPVTRSIIDVSNIVSLNIYTSAIGPDVLAETSTTNAGLIIMNKLGLQGLVADATQVASQQASFLNQINSTPGALMAVAFVLYAAYIFFMATAILAIRTAVLVFLTIASPLMLVDTVIPKLGEVAAKMRKMYFEQLVVAPVFMIMLALTLKFMDIFQTSGAFSSTGSMSSFSGTGTDSVKVFFGIFMMLIMLHIMLKVTKSLAGEAGNYATSFMGKVGGFGLAAATGGTGILARGTIGQAALQARDSAWMDRMKDTKVGRGLYGLSNSLAQSTFDARNVGMVNRSMVAAGLTGGLGLTMQKGVAQGYEQQQKAREEKVLQFGNTIHDDKTRASYFKNINKGSFIKADENKLKIATIQTQQKKDAKVDALITTEDQKEREIMITQALADKDFAMADKLKAGDAYLKVKNTGPDAASTKAKELKTMKLTDEQVRKIVEKQDPFADLKKLHEEKIKQMQAGFDKMPKITDEEKKAYDQARRAIAVEKENQEKQIKDLKKATLDAYFGTPHIPPNPPSAGTADKGKGDGGGGGGGGGSPVNEKPKPSNPGGSNTAQYQSSEYQTPASQRTRTMNEREIEETRNKFATSSFADSRRKGKGDNEDDDGNAPASLTPQPHPQSPSPAAEAVAL